MNRAQRRAMNRNTKRSPEQWVRDVERNGITRDDLDMYYEKGFKTGFQEAAPNITKMIYAAVALAARKNMRYGHRRIRRLLEWVDHEVVCSFSSEEAIDEVWDEVGLRLEFADPLEPIREVAK